MRGGEGHLTEKSAPDDGSGNSRSMFGSGKTNWFIIGYWLVSQTCWWKLLLGALNRFTQHQI